MRKLRNAALVAAMLGTFSMLGAGVATAAVAHGDRDGKGKGRDTNVVVCEQRSRVTDDTDQLGLINLATGPITLLGSGPASTVSVQQICSGEDTAARNNAVAETGSGLDLGLDLL